MSAKERNGLNRFKKLCMVTLLAAGMLMGVAGGAKAIEFKAKGEWLVGFGVGDGNLTKNSKDNNGNKTKTNSDDQFGASQRVRLQLDAVASEALSGTVYFEIGDQKWGKADEGGALGADGRVVEVKNAYIDWLIPQTDARLRMGIQTTTLPNVAGGSAVLDADAAALTANYKFNDTVGLSFMWARPVNDNFGNGYFDLANNKSSTEKANYLDNLDLFMLSMPLHFDGVEATPWAMYGMRGKNALRGLEDPVNNSPWETNDGKLGLTLPGLTPGFNYANANITPLTNSSTSKQYGSLFWAGLPVAITAFDPLNIEFDINYGYSEAMGRFDVLKRGEEIVRASTGRQGWLAKALVEYKLDWATPGIFGWYASGDDGNVKNGSERMPSIAGAGNFTSFIGDGNLSWSPVANGCDWNMSYAGTWGIGAQLKDMSFMENITHTFRLAYWGGTNAPSMVKYMSSASAWQQGYGGDGPYLTTNDGLLEFNIVNTWQAYENLGVNLELGYVANMMDKGTWKKAGYNNGAGNGSFEKQDAWKAQVVFQYTF
ncbi:outer membrane homotrimeric porin [Desulfovibrio sp.]|uniref:outer membrane homotrimeric porin n=1 Tax=Desulfovibrio sp. TaxID=885 RepID=UPI0035B4B34A